jgi:N-acetylneuraminic acid mutarotase
MLAWLERCVNNTHRLTGKFYHAGGYSENYTATLNSVEVYDPNTNTWTAVPDMPTPRGDTMCTTLNNALVVIGGYYDPTGEPSMTSSKPDLTLYMWD